jgi:hypothetical protein
MKILFLLLALFVLSGCASQISAFKEENVLAKPNPTIDDINNINSNDSTPVPDKTSSINQTQESEGQNEEFAVPSEEFKKVDFKNFKYLTKTQGAIHLVNGIFEHNERLGGETFELRDAYYVDLTNHSKKEAIVWLSVLSCGASCDGGANLFYIYSMEKNKPKLLWKFETGSLAYGEGLKSFTVKNKKIIIEQFGKDSADMYKFSTKGTIRSAFGYRGKKIVQESKEIIPTPERNVMNYSAEISINE